MGHGIITRRGGGGLEGIFGAAFGLYPNSAGGMSTFSYDLASTYKYALVFTTSTGTQDTPIYKARIILVDFEKQQTSIMVDGSWTAPIVSVSGHTITVNPHGSYCLAAAIGIG